MARIVQFGAAPGAARPGRRNVATTAGLMAGAFLVAAGVVGGLLNGVLPPSAATASAPDRISAQFDVCGRGKRVTCVVDGDTFWLHGDKVRIADIDAPEVFSYECAAEKALGDRATARLVALMNAGPFSLAPADRDRDVYGRELRFVARDGRSLGGELVAEGLARTWDGARHPWC